jgi:hypothetical protein
MQRRADLRVLIDMAPSDSFEQYLRKTYRHAHPQWAPQIGFVNDHLGQRLVHDIIKLEEIDAAMPPILTRLGLEGTNIPHKNRSQPAGPRHVPTATEQELLMELYAEDFDTFGYDPEADVT